MYEQVFIEETNEILEELTAVFLDLEQTPHDRELINRAFRGLHTIKGSASMFGFAEISTFVHDAETLFDRVRGGKLAIDKELIDLNLAALDIIRAMLAPDRADFDPRAKEEVSARFRAHGGEAAPAAPAAPPPVAAHEFTLPPPEENGVRAIYRIRFKPKPDFLQTGVDPLQLLAELQGLGAAKITAQTGQVPEMAELDLESSYLFWDLILTTEQGLNAIRDIFILVEEHCELAIEVLDQNRLEEEDKKLGEILVERGDVSPAAIAQVLAKQDRLGDLLVKEGAIAPGELDSALLEQQQVRAARQKRTQEQSLSSIRISAEKIDELVNLVGEIITIQAQLSQVATQLVDPTLSNIAEENERLTARLRENTMGMRMLPIETIFGKFRRVVRDLAKELGKEIDLLTTGSETELDKTLIEQLTDPLMHLIRNCVDHGIEGPATRLATGKASTGKIILAARHSGDHVSISVSDDGKGLSVAAIRQKALAQGLITHETVLSEGEILGLIFTPGFSLAEKVTNVSGRGVGMDVVKRNIEGLQGTIEIDSQLGVGTKMILRVPLTLAIIEGLLVETGEDRYILPLSTVQECHEQTREDIVNAHGNQVLKVRGRMVPYICLRQRFGIEGEVPAVRRIVLCEANERQIGIAVDRVIGSLQTVIKPLGEVYRNIDCLSGATILGDGTVALIVNPSKMMRKNG